MDNATFIFQGWEITEETILFHYNLLRGEKSYQFTDTLILPRSFDRNTIPEQLLKELLNNLLLMFGISYWKLYCPKEVKIEQYSLTKEQAEFWNTVYRKGLGQFFYENKIDYRGLIQFPFDSNKTIEPIHFSRQDRSLLPLGGGKDSVVAAELLKKAGKPFSVVTVYTGLNNSSAQEAVTQEIGNEKIVIKRMLDPQLFQLNKEKDTYNGHVPAVAMLSWINLFLAAIYDYRYVIFADEESANYGNVEYLGEMVNHQWSKSLEFEELLQDYLKKFVTKDIQYFSLLRPFSEIKIAQLFSEYSQYFSMFVSCNRAYRMIHDGKASWCGQCPKCAFVFLLLAAFIPKEKVIQIFGKNLFDDKTLLPLYEELLGVKAFKPFECVGTPEEAKLAFYYASRKNEWQDTVVIDYFNKEILPGFTNKEEVEKKLLSKAEEKIPEEFKAIVQ